MFLFHIHLALTVALVSENDRHFFYSWPRVVKEAAYKELLILLYKGRDFFRVSQGPLGL